MAQHAVCAESISGVAPIAQVTRQSINPSTKPLSAADRLERVANMLDLGRTATVSPDDRNNIEAAPLFEQVVPAQKVKRGHGEPSLLLQRHRLGRYARGNQVDLTPKRVIAARHDSQTRSPKVPGRRALAPVTEQTIPESRYVQFHEP
jgi:hypothetical protein